MGIATRSGCGGLCPQAQMPCTGCYGAPEGVADHGAKMVAALGSILDIGDVKDIPESELAGRVDEIISRIPDYAGTFYKYTLADSILKNALRR
jgi:F420-non-reducing hydrogenase small subunit